MTVSDRSFRGRIRRATLIVLAATAAIAGSTALIAVLESAGGIDDASPVYLIAVVALGAAFGTWPALATAVTAFVIYDLLFTAPRFSLRVDDPREWLDLLLFLFVAIAVGRLVALQRQRTDEAEQRTREASSLFALSRMLATTTSTESAAPDIARRLTEDVGLDHVWIMIGPTGRERLVADTGDGDVPSSSVVAVLQRRPGDLPAEWVRTHVPREGKAAVAATSIAVEHLRVRIEADGDILGILAATRPRTLGTPSLAETRVMALAADQIALSLRRDQAQRISTDLEVSRRSEGLKTALIDSVSHDFRTPLASIRATAGGLVDPAVEWTAEARREAAGVIDAEAARLDHLVRGILELGRIESGSLDPDLEPHDVRSLVEPAVRRVRPSFGERDVVLDLDEADAPVLVDDALFDIVLTNLLENVLRHAPAPAGIRVSARSTSDDRLEVTVEDSGPGVPDGELARLFERFHRVARPGEGARRGMGIGLSVVRGLTEAMGGTVQASRSALGGLAVTIALRTVQPPPELEL